MHRALRALRQKKHPDALRAELPAPLPEMGLHLSDM